MSTYYLSDAKVALTDAGVQNGGIIYDDNTSKLDYSKVGNIQLGVFTSEASIEWGAPTYKDLSQFAGCVDFSKFSMEYTVTNTDKLQIDKAGIVTLKKYGVPSYLETPNTGIVSAFAKSTAYYLVGGNTKISNLHGLKMLALKNLLQAQFTMILRFLLRSRNLNS